MKFAFWLLVVTVVLDCVISIIPDDDTDGLGEVEIKWRKFKKRHGRKYKNKGDEAVRRNRYVKRLQRILAHNKREALGLETFTVEDNEFTDMSDDEVQVLMGAKFPDDYAPPDPLINPEQTISERAVPPSVDWRSQGLVGPVLNQGKCGSCWAFSAVAALEGQLKKKSGTLTGLSQQNLVDCATAQGNSGCDGGWMPKAFNYVQSNGIDTYASYPYEGALKTCRFKPSSVGTKSVGYVSVPASDEALKNATAVIGPIAVAIYASDRNFLNYRSGIYSNPNCPKSVNHGVTLVGYSTNPNYWIIKNSWGTKWGEGGYARMAMDSNACGISTKGGFYPLL